MGTKTRTWGGTAVGTYAAGGVTTTTSPRDSNGRLILRANTHRKYKTELNTTNKPWWAWYGTANFCWFYGVPVTTLKSRCGTAYAQAYRSFRDQAHGQAQMMLAVDVGERKKTYMMIAKAIGHVLSLAKAVAKKDAGAIRRALVRADSFVHRGSQRSRSFAYRRPRTKADFGSLWLEYRYGWQPLLGSIQNGLELLSHQRSFPEFIRGTGGGTYKARSVDHINSSVMHCDVDAHLHVTLKGRVVLNNPDLYRLNQYGLVNPLSTAWELVPFSFVVDWFVKVGDYLSNLTDWVGITFNDLSVTYSARGTCTFVSKGQNPSPGPINQKFGGSIGLAKTRELLGTPPVPEIQFGSGFQVQREKWTAEKRAADVIAFFSSQAAKASFRR